MFLLFIFKQYNQFRNPRFVTLYTSRDFYRGFPFDSFLFLPYNEQIKSTYFRAVPDLKRREILDANLSNEEIYDILEREIITLVIKPGEQISENTLCKRFCLSRTPVRSVLQRLQQNGFVQIVPHKGTMVTTIDLDIASQWIYQRLAVECMVLRDFLYVYSPTDLARIHYIHQQLLDIAATRHTAEHFDINTFLAVDLSMHRVWFQTTDKLHLWDTLTRPQADYSRFIRLDIVGARNVPDVVVEHQELIRIIEKRDNAEIEPLLKRHLYGGVRRMGGQIFSEEYRNYFKQRQSL